MTRGHGYVAPELRGIRTQIALGDRIRDRLAPGGTAIRAETAADRRASTMGGVFAKLRSNDGRGE